MHLIPIDPKDPLLGKPFCKNCQSTLWAGDRHCPDCGQKVYNGPPSLWQLFSDFFETVFNLDNRLFRTLTNLFVPGRLTRRYMNGQRRPFLNPLRFYFLSAVAMLAAFAFMLTGFYREDMEASQLEQLSRDYHQVFNEEVELHADSIRQSFSEPVAILAIDSLERLLRNSDSDSTVLGYLNFSGLSFETEQFNIAAADAVSITSTQLLDKYKIEGWMNRFQVAQVLRLRRLDARGISILMSQLIWGLLLLVPLCALMLKIIHIRNKRYFMEHFVLSLHVHTFLFILLITATLLYYFFDNNIGYWTTLILVPIYFYVTLLRYYQQGWFKTFVKMGILFFSYLFIVIFCTIFSALISVAMY